jgi:hypothetical protein
MHSRNSPTRIGSKTMLSFDLRRRSSQDGKLEWDELVVERAPDRRRSSGRFTLHSYIQKKITLEACSSVLEKRRMVETDAPERSGTQSASTTDPPAVGKRKTRKMPTKSDTAPVPSRSSLSDELVPLGQELAPISEIDPVDECSPFVSQTQVYVSPGRQGVQTPLKMASPVPFMATPPTVDFQRIRSPPQRSLSPVSEESLPIKNIRKPVLRSKFLDIEASESSDGSGGDESEGSDSDLSDLIASGTVESEDENSHRRLHMQWEMEEDKKLQKRIEEAGEPVGRDKRPKGVIIPKPGIANAKVPLRKHRRVQKSKLPAPAPPPVAQQTTRKPNFSTRSRRSSVSCGSEVEFRVVKNHTKKPAGQFSFLARPPSELLARTNAIQESKQAAELQSVAPSKLMGAKRFVFGQVN